jgi:hypothetical protein
VSSGGLNRRELLGAGAAAGAALALGGESMAAAADTWSRTVDFAALGAGDGWPGWSCPGVANLRRGEGTGLLEAGSDVFPCDPRPVAFAHDLRFRDGEITATITSAGAGAGVVARRVAPRLYYAAVYDDERGALVLLRREPGGVQELGSAPLARPSGPFDLTLSTTGSEPTRLRATVGAAVVVATDSTQELARAGDPGVLATARTLYPSQGPAALPALGNIHLLPYGVQEGEQFNQSPAGAQVLATIRERSTGVFSRIVLRGSDGPAPTRPSVVAATNGSPAAGGALLRVATDVTARVEIELATNPRFRHSRRIKPRPTDDFLAVFARAARLRPGRRVYWRARLRRGGHETVGPTRSFRVLPRGGSAGSAKVAIAACASQFGPIFDQLTARDPDVFVWQGDLNYPDTIGPLAQTIPAYAGIWRDFMANPRMSTLLERSLFAAQRDDHDYGVQDANSTNLVPWGLTPWESLVEGRQYYRFAAGPAEFWVLDQRRHKSDPKAPDGESKTLLGAQQRAWLFRTLAASHAQFKVICSPCTVAVPANGRDGNWSSGFTAERDLLLAHISDHVSGQALFVTGDTHWTLVYDKDGLFEARPCPLGIPTPNDITIASPNAAADARKTPGVLYADDEKGHFALAEVGGRRGAAWLDLTLVREDGAEVFKRRFEERPQS